MTPADLIRPKPWQDFIRAEVSDSQLLAIPAEPPIRILGHTFSGAKLRPEKVMDAPAVEAIFDGTRGRVAETGPLVVNTAAFKAAGTKTRRLTETASESVVEATMGLLMTNVDSETQANAEFTVPPNFTADDEASAMQEPKPEPVTVTETDPVLGRLLGRLPESEANGPANVRTRV